MESETIGLSCDLCSRREEWQDPLLAVTEGEWEVNLSTGKAVCSGHSEEEVERWKNETLR